MLFLFSFIAFQLLSPKDESRRFLNGKALNNEKSLQKVHIYTFQVV